MEHGLPEHELVNFIECFVKINNRLSLSNLSSKFKKSSINTYYVHVSMFNFTPTGLKI